MRLAIVLALTVALSAQDPSFDVESRLVMVPTTVTDSHGRSVDTLEAEDFTVLDNGRPRRFVVDTLATGVAPIALVVAVQASGISLPVLKKVQKVGSMIQPILTGDRGCAAVVAFSERVQWLQECTKDPDELDRAFRHLAPGDDKSGRMLDAISQAVNRLRKIPNVRRVLLLISETRDRGSETSLEDVITSVQASGVTVYAATYSAYKTAFTIRPSETQQSQVPADPPNPTGKPSTLPADDRVPIPTAANRADVIGALGEVRRLYTVRTTDALIGQTGGTAFPFTRLKGLEAAIQKLSDELHRQYVLSFTPEQAEPGFHKIEVRVSRRDLRVRARPGYWAAEKVK